MPRFRLIPLLPLVLALAAVLLPGSARSAAKATALNVTVGPGFTIRVTDAAGGNVTQLDPGEYAITIKNLSPNQEHNFHLLGPGLNKKTGVAFRGSVSWKVRFKAGKKYTVRSDAHRKLRRTFTATAP